MLMFSGWKSESLKFLSVLDSYMVVEAKETNTLFWKVAELVPAVTCVYQPKQATYQNTKATCFHLTVHFYHQDKGKS